MNDLADLKKSLSDHEDRLNALEQRIKFPAAEGQISIKGAGIEKLAEKVGTSIENLQRLFDLENNTLTLLKVEGIDEAEKTKKVALIVLLGYKYIFGIENVLSTEIRRNIAENKVMLDNFAKNLNKTIPTLIRRIGKPKSKNTKYKLTTPGEVEAKEIVKQMCNDKNVRV